MGKLDNTRQQSIKAWGPAQKKWQQDLQKHPNFVTEAQNQNDSEASAAAAAAAGFGGGGGYANLPLTSLQTTTVVHTKEYQGNYYYVAMNHTTGETHTEVDSGVSQIDWPTMFWSAGDAMGYTVFNYIKDDLRRMQIVSPTGAVITDYSWSYPGYPGHDIYRYYGGGIGVMLYNLSLIHI